MKPWIIGPAAFLSFAAGGFYGFVGGSSERVVFLSVGQGDCTLVQSEGRAVLIDVGPKEAGVAAKLHRLGVERVDLILLSHPDADHVGGLGEVCSSYPEAVVESPACFEHDEKMTSVIDSARPARTIWSSGENDAVGGFSFTIRCHSWREGEDDNIGSMFVRVADGGASLTTSGDGPSSEEADELPLADWRSEIIHFGHHGSHTASSEAWLEDVHPRYGIVSCGLHNRYGHPHADVLARAKSLGIEVHRTDLEGDIEFDVKNGGFVLKK